MFKKYHRRSKFPQRRSQVIGSLFSMYFSRIPGCGFCLGPDLRVFAKLTGNLAFKAQKSCKRDDL